MNFNEMWAAEIRTFRYQAVCDATHAAVDADFPADVVAGIAQQAGEQWDREHPQLVSDLRAVA